jgi:AcrR family transcriptional regulator
MSPQERVNRRELIVETATNLFVEQGYDATSVRQIADQVGCTEAALYYHFKDGKRELLQEVVGTQYPDLASVVEGCRGAESLEELVLRYGAMIRKIGPPHIHKLRWLSAEFANLEPDEQDFIREKQMNLHRGMAELIARFVDSQEEADALAWVMISCGYGYGQLFINFDLQAHVDFPPERLIATLAKLLAPCETCEE